MSFELKLCSQEGTNQKPKTRRRKEARSPPLKNNPQNWSILGVVLHEGGSSLSGFLDYKPPNKEHFLEGGSYNQHASIVKYFYPQWVGKYKLARTGSFLGLKVAKGRRRKVSCNPSFVIERRSEGSKAIQLLAHFGTNI